MNQNSILLRRRNKVIVSAGKAELPSTHLATINKNLEGLGYTLSKNVLDALGRCSIDDAVNFYEELTAILKELRGVQDYKPMYPNFPRQVMEASAAELYVNAILHYLTTWVSDITWDQPREIVWLPNYTRESRKPNDSVKLTVIELGSEEELTKIFVSMLSSKSSISETDKAELRWYISNFHLPLPDVIPNKEVLAFVGSLMPERAE